MRIKTSKAVGTVLTPAISVNVLPTCKPQEDRTADISVLVTKGLVSSLDTYHN